MATSPSSLRIVGLDAKRKAELAAQAKRLGLSPQHYVKQLIEDGLALEREARERTFDDILAPVRETAGADDVPDLDDLVDRARTRHHSTCRTPAKKQKR